MPFADYKYFACVKVQLLDQAHFDTGILICYSSKNDNAVCLAWGFVFLIAAPEIIAYACKIRSLPIVLFFYVVWIINSFIFSCHIPFIVASLGFCKELLLLWCVFCGIIMFIYFTLCYSIYFNPENWYALYTAV